MKIVIVGGGFAGIKTALLLANKPQFDVQLISNNTHFEYHGALYRSAVGHSPLEVVIPLKEIFADAKNVELILDDVTTIDNKKRLLSSSTDHVYPYDKVILALGSTVNYFGIEGLEDHTENLSTISNTIRLRKHLVELFQTTRKTPVRIAVIGAGPSGIELVGELQTFANFIAKKYNIKPVQVQPLLVEGSGRILPSLLPKTSEKVTRRLHKLGVEIHLGIKVESCKKNELCLSAGNLGADSIIWSAGSKPVGFYEQNPSVFVLSRNSRVEVDEYLQARTQEDAFVLGDNANTPYSGMAQTALHDAQFLARNLLREVSGKPPKKYRAVRPTYVVTVGNKWAVVQKNKTITSGYRGWLIRRQADLAIFKHFRPYEQAIKTWRQAQRMSDI